MEISVSDVLTFSKCPYLWWKGYVHKQVPKQTAAMSFGTKVHATVAGVMRGLMNPLTAEILDAEDYKTIISDTSWNMKNCKVVAVEKPDYFTYGGHTFLYRPDAIIVDSWENYCSYQIKTVSANKRHTLDYVKYSVHEAIYGYGIGLKYNVNYIPKVVLDRFIKSKVANKPLVWKRDVLIPPRISTYKHLNYCVFIADRMEEMLSATTQGEEADEEAAKLWSNRSHCIDWITGVRCPAFTVCYGYGGFDGNFEPASDRYADLDRSQPPAQG